MSSQISSLPDGMTVTQTSELRSNTNGSAYMMIFCLDEEGHTIRFAVIFYPDKRPPSFVQVVAGCMEHQPNFTGIPHGPCQCQHHV